MMKPSKTNMSPAALRDWKQTEAYREYRSDRGAETVDTVVRRTMRALQGRAGEDTADKIDGFIARMKANNAGERKYGSGNAKISAKTASLRNWGFDPTGRFA